MTIFINQGQTMLANKLRTLCLAANGNIAAIDYLTMGDIRATTPQDTKVAYVGELKHIVSQIKSLCKPDELAFFEFYFERRDLDNAPRSALHLAKLVYPNNLYVGDLICAKFRGDNFRADELIAAALSCTVGNARKIIIKYTTDNGDYSRTDEMKLLRKLLANFTNTRDYLLAGEIEDILIKNDLL